jgi:hypothetical protein
MLPWIKLQRILICLGIGAGSGFLCLIMMRHLELGAADFNWTLRAARDLVAGRDPYNYAFEHTIPYPLPAAIFGLPLIWVKPEIAGAIFFGASSALLAFGLTRGGYTRLLIFLAYPYWAALLTVQWSPLVMAAALQPWLLPTTLAKPQIGLPVALTHLTRRGMLACTIVLIASLIVMPSWPIRWVSQIGHYEYYIPLLVLPGPAILLALWRRRDPDSHLLLLSAMVPARWFYDSFILWLIPKNRREILATAFLSWGAGIWRWYQIPHSWAEVGMWAVMAIYLPMLTVVMLRGMEGAKRGAKLIG